MESSWPSGGEIMFETIDVNGLYPRWLTAQEKAEACTIIDVRSPEEYAEAHVPNAKLIALNTLMARADEIPKQGDVFLICRSGARSAQAASFLAQQLGHDNLINVSGGTMAWKAAGYPVEVGA